MFLPSLWIVYGFDVNYSRATNILWLVEQQSKSNKTEQAVAKIRRKSGKQTNFNAFCWKWLLWHLLHVTDGFLWSFGIVVPPVSGWRCFLVLGGPLSQALKCTLWHFDGRAKNIKQNKHRPQNMARKIKRKWQKSSNRNGGKTGDKAKNWWWNTSAIHAILMGIWFNDDDAQSYHV